MARSDTWPGGAVLEPLSSMDSAGSCDSVISASSAASDDSMEHLSSEERACLMYLEETIEQLEMMEDSGLSNDEPDALLKTDEKDEMSSSENSGSKDESPADDRVLHEGAGAAADPSLSIFSERELNRSQTTEPPSEPEPDSSIKDIKPVFLQVECALPAPGLSGDTKLFSPPVQPKGDADKSMISEVLAGDSDTNLGLIPPPPDFMDETDAPSDPEEHKEIPPVSVETKDICKSDRLVSPPSPETVENTPQMSPLEGAAEPKPPPVVAPKPKILPANILRRSLKYRGVSSDGLSGNERVVVDPQKDRMEALRKLGLLKSSDEATPAPTTQTRKSHEVPPSPDSPGVQPASPETAPLAHVHSLPVAVASLPPATPPPPQDPDVLPAPEAFSDSPKTPFPHSNASEVFSVKNPHRVTRSATMEHCNSRRSRQATGHSDDEHKLKQIRNSRPRPFSFGGREDFSRAKDDVPRAGHATNSHSETNKASQHPKEASKLPRAQGISVLICPQAEQEENRREALKKLGLLRY